MDLEKLKEPFPADAIDWRVGQAGVTRDGKPWCKVLAYLTSRAVMDRLDEVCGPTGWEDHYVAGPQGGVLCRLTIHHPDRTVTREDAAENTDVEAVKGGVSDALKRAAVKFGVGRYLYRLGDSFAECRTEKPGWDERADWHFAKTKDGTAFYWRAPALPDWALPEKEVAKQKAMEATKGFGANAPKPAAQMSRSARGVDHKRLILSTLVDVCGCETDQQKDAVINYVTGGVYTAASELDDPEDARKVHAAFREFGKKHRLDGLALTEEVGSAFGF